MATAAARRAADAPAPAQNTGSDSPGISHDDFMTQIGLKPVPSLLGRRHNLATPVAYDTACKAIAQCIKIDDAKEWATKADALAVWAKLYGDDQVGIEARRLKLHAYRRMAHLAEELLPQWAASQTSRHRTSALSVLKAEGVTTGIAQTVRKVGQLSDSKFNKAVNAAKPPTPGTLVHVDNAASPGFVRLARAMSVLQTICNHNRPEPLAKALDTVDRSRAKVMTAKLSAWLARFEAAL